MHARFVVLDRPRLLDRLVGFMALSHASTSAPQPTGALSSRTAPIPPALRDSSRNTAEAVSVWISGLEAEAYNNLRHYLGALRETEWLSTEELDERLWTVACEIALATEDFATDTQRHARAEQLLSDVLRALRLYEVIFTVDHITPPAEPIVVWDAQLAAGTAALMYPFVERARKDFQEGFRAPFLGKTVLLLQVEGTAARPVIERARALAHHRLHMLRSSLASHRQTHPDQLRFGLGQDAIARALSGPPDGHQAWSRPPATPIDLELHPGHAERLQELQEIHAALGSAHASLRGPVERAWEWIGRGLCRHWPGDALRDYTTAIEVLLITSEKEKKSVLVPFRMLALADLHGDRMIHPAAIRHAYDSRSVVVHEGRGEAGDEQTTRRMLGAARDCLGWLAHFAATHPSDDHAALLEALDTPALRAKALAWLERVPDPWSKKLVDGIRSLPK
jgi:hypothetical protein